MSRSIVIDPWTQKSMEERCTRGFTEVLSEIIRDVGEDGLDAMDAQEIAELFFCNGYFKGAIDATGDESLRDDIELILDEIDYQKENNM